MPDSPQIYDITEIPYFAFSPGSAIWISLITLAILIASLFIFWPKIRIRRFKKSGLELARKELEQMIASTPNGTTKAPLLDKNQLIATSLIVKRALSSSAHTALSQQHIYEMNVEELKKLKQQTKSKALQEITSILILLDSAKYQPDNSNQNIGTDTLKNIVLQLSKFEQESKTGKS